MVRETSKLHWQAQASDARTCLPSPAQAATNLFVRNGKRDAKIVLTGSILSMMGLVGYSQYAPMKFAIRGTFEGDFLRAPPSHSPALTLFASLHARRRQALPSACGPSSSCTA